MRAVSRRGLFGTDRSYRFLYTSAAVFGPVRPALRPSGVQLSGVTPRKVGPGRWR